MRPSSIGGSISAREFVDGFDRASPPNEAVVVIDDAEEENVVIVQLKNPQDSEDDGTLRYSATIIEDYETEKLSYYELMKDLSISEVFGPVSIYIDAYPTVVNSQITDAIRSSQP